MASAADLQLIVSAVPTLQTAPFSLYHGSDSPRSSSSKTKCDKSNIESSKSSFNVSGANAAVEKEGSRHQPLMAICPTRGSVSIFGCFTAAASLLEDLTAEPTDASATAAAAPADDVGPASLLHAAWVAPAVWLCGRQAAHLKRGLEALTGVDPMDLGTVSFQKQQQQQQTQPDKNLNSRVALLHVKDRAAPPDRASSTRPSLKQQLLWQLQLLHLAGPGGLPNCYLAVETLQRATVGGVVLQCCELVGQLMRIGQESLVSGSLTSPYVN